MSQLKMFNLQNVKKSFLLIIRDIEIERDDEFSNNFLSDICGFPIDWGGSDGIANKDIVLCILSPSEPSDKIKM